MSQAVTKSKKFQSTLPTRGSDLCMLVRDRIQRVSIHAPHEGERRILNKDTQADLAVSIHAPHEGERPTCRAISASWARFQSTLPTRGSDGLSLVHIPLCNTVSIHAPHEGERPKPCAGRRCASAFQSTLPTRGSDFAAQARHPPPYRFNPRSPRGGATRADLEKWVRRKVSIHAPHEGERHEGVSSTERFQGGFNPRSPRGGATFMSMLQYASTGVSIHAPHEGERPAAGH